MQFSHLCSSVISYPIGTKFAREVPASKGSLHTKFEENRSSHFRDTSEQNFVLISSFFSSSTSSFRTLRKIRHKTRMRARIGVKFGTLKGLIKADLCTNFGRNPMNIHGVMTDYLRKIRSKVCHAYRVNYFEESVENCYVVQWICDNFCMNCAFCDKNMKFGTVLGHVLRKIFSYRGIQDLSYCGCGTCFKMATFCAIWIFNRT